MNFPSETILLCRGEPYITIHESGPDLEKSWGSLLANANHTAVPVK
jgi:hypothetical protein